VRFAIILEIKQRVPSATLENKMWVNAGLREKVYPSLLDIRLLWEGKIEGV
jgi:hypothetical protein